MSLEPCVPHPDGSGWTPIASLLAELYSRQRIMSTILDVQAQSIAQHDEQFTAVTARLSAAEAEAAALRQRVTDLEGLPSIVESLSTELAATTKALAEVAARVEVLEPRTGPAFGVDVSGHQSLAQVQALAADPEQDFIIVKATEGMGGRNDKYAEQRAAAGAKFLGAYHFAWTGQDPLREAENFLATAALKPGDVAFLDAEKYNDTDPIDWAKSVAFCLTWLDTVKARTGAKPAVYVNWNWIKGLRAAATVAQWDRLVEYPLWLAQWATPPTPGVHDTVSPKTGSSKGWPIVLHQYGVIDNLDRNYAADVAALHSLAIK